MLLAFLLLLAPPQAAAAPVTVEPGTEGVITIVLSGDPAGRVKVELTQNELTDLSENRTEGRAVLAITNLFTFPISISAPSYTVKVNGADFGTGEVKKEKKFRPKKRSALELPFRGKKAAFEGAAGGLWVVGANVPSEIVGTFNLLINGKTIPVEFHLTFRMGTDGARSGVFAHPMGR